MIIGTPCGDPYYVIKEPTYIEGHGYVNKGVKVPDSPTVGLAKYVDRGMLDGPFIDVIVAVEAVWDMPSKGSSLHYDHVATAGQKFYANIPDEIASNFEYLIEHGGVKKVTERCRFIPKHNV